MSVILELRATENEDGSLSVKILPVKKSPHIQDKVLDSENLQKQLATLCVATATCVLFLEEKGIFKKGEAMHKAINRIQDEYIFPNDIVEFKISNDGKIKDS